MPREVNDEQLAGVLAAPAGKQYGHFISLAADWEEVWLAQRDGIVDDLLPRVEAEGDEVAVLPMADGRSVTVPVERLRSDLQDELKMLYGD